MTSANQLEPIDDDIWKQYPAINTARVWSLQRVESIRVALVGLESEAPAVRGIVLSGSLARLDAGPQSDGDFIIVLDDQMPLDGDTAVEAVRIIRQRLSSLRLRSSRAGGIYATPTSREQLCDGPCGIVSEAVEVFGKRIQLLLEARPVFGVAACRALQREILLRYASQPFARRSHEFWDYLTDDLIRYWRSYRVWRHWDDNADNGGWYLRNIKLRYSRLLSYSSLLLSCTTDLLEHPNLKAMNDSKLLDVISLTPLERIWRIDQQLDAGVFASICRYYDGFLQVINNGTCRRAMEQAAPSSLSEAFADCPPAFADLLIAADRLRVEFVRLLQRLPASKRDHILARLMF